MPWHSRDVPVIDKGVGLTYKYRIYCQTFNISHTIVGHEIIDHSGVVGATPTGNEIVDHSDVVGAAPAGAAPTTSSFST